MVRKPTLGDIADSLEKCFANDEALPKQKRELAKILSEETRGYEIMKNEFKKDTLGNRQKSYEELSTSRNLMPNTPIYARIDGRAFHTLCRGLKKPFSTDFIETMQDVCRYLVETTNACLGYVQSDEISLGWKDSAHAPFDGRIQKLESNLASIASARFVKHVYDGQFLIDGSSHELFARISKYLPTFDCRVFNVPSMVELANAFLWRENDAIKNSISGMALSFYSHRKLQNKNSDEKIHMMRMKGYCFYEDTMPAFLRGTFYRRQTYRKEIIGDELARIPEKNRTTLMCEKDAEDVEHFFCMRAIVAPMKLPYRLTETAELHKVLFEDAVPVCKISNPTFDLSNRTDYV